MPVREGVKKAERKVLKQFGTSEVSTHVKPHKYRTGSRSDRVCFHVYTSLGLHGPGRYRSRFRICAEVLPDFAKLNQYRTKHSRFG
jgi:hypothetical protein